MNENQAKRITEFLSEYKFISVDEAEEKVRLTEDVRRFLFETVTS